MANIYVNENDVVITVDNGYFCLNQKNGAVHKVPKESLETITLLGNATLTTPCIKECLQLGIPISFFSNHCNG